MIGKAAAIAGILGLAALGPAPAAAQTEGGEAPAQTVASVEIAGLTAGDTLRILRTLGIRPGDAVTASTLRDAAARVWKLDLFDDLSWASVSTPEGLALTLHVVERPRITAVHFEGNQQVDDDDLLKASGLAVGTRVSGRLLAAAQDSLLRTYRKKGFVQARAESSTRPDGAGAVAVTFQIQEGAEARVHDFAFDGAAAFTQDELSGQLDSKKKGFLRSGKMDPEKVQKDVQKLFVFYRDRGYKDVAVNPDSMRFSEDGKRITLVYRIQEGERYRVGDVSWSGYTSLDERQVQSLEQPRQGEWYSGSRVQKAVEGAYGQYAELGYLYVNVDPQELVSAPGIVDLTFRVQEGEPSRVHRVQITGNTYTKEKVIRRELALREGDRFSRTLLMRSQQDIFRLGYFEDVQVDFRPAEGSDVDVILRIKEKQTGTATAGAGYSSGTGLTGFVQLGHNNLFGNGQSVNVQLERGSRRNTISLSFNDPWFLDTRTSFGFSIFTREQITEVYATTGEPLEIREQRRGGSLQWGQRLKFIDYSRGYITYRLENVNQSVNEEGSALSDAQRALAEQVVSDDGSITTSSVTLSIVRDSRNHPFYPSGGGRTVWSSEFAGNLLGGSVPFTKHELDYRVFGRSVVPGVASMIRWRGGILTGYGDPTPVPDYERFRLGGTTYYGVRGYQDYELVPADNVQAVLDTAGNPTGAFVRYPGGRWMQIVSFEQQFPIFHPLHGALFVDGGNTWNGWEQIQPLKFNWGAGFGARVEIPLLGNIGLDIAYGFNRDQPGWRTHFLLGNAFF